jgi:hypothetical protein
MKKYFYLLFIIFCLHSCEVDPDEPTCWICEFSATEEVWEETFCDMTYDEIRDYEDQVYYETSGEIDVHCYYQK